MDTLDISIIRALQLDARRPFTEIANEIEVAEGTVRKRVARLLSDGTLRLKGTVDPHKAGFNAPAFIHVSVKPGTLDEVAARLSSLPEVSYLVAVTGTSDLLVELMCRDRNHLMALISEQIHTIPGITATNTAMILRIYKELLPNLVDPGNGNQ